MKTHLPNPLNDEEKHIILSILEEKDEHIRLAFKTILYTGLRVGEASSLTKRDVTLEDEKVVLLIREGKGGKFRKVPIVDVDTAKELYHYSRDVPDGEPLFRVSKRTLQDHARRIKERTGIPLPP